MSPAEIEAELGSRETAELMVWPEHWKTWDAWLHLGTQWRLASGLGGARYQGIEFGSVPLALEMANVTEAERAAVIKGLCAMQAAALPVLNGRAAAS